MLLAGAVVGALVDAPAEALPLAVESAVALAVADVAVAAAPFEGVEVAVGFPDVPAFAGDDVAVDADEPLD